MEDAEGKWRWGRVRWICCNLRVKCLYWWKKCWSLQIWLKMKCFLYLNFQSRLQEPGSRVWRILVSTRFELVFTNCSIIKNLLKSNVASSYTVGTRFGHGSGVEASRIFHFLSDPDSHFILGSSRSLRGLYKRHCWSANIAVFRSNGRLPEFEQELDSQV